MNPIQWFLLIVQAIQAVIELLRLIGIMGPREARNYIRKKCEECRVEKANNKGR